VISFSLSAASSATGIELAAEEEHYAGDGIFWHCLDLIAEFEHFLDLSRQGFERFDNSGSRKSRDGAYARSSRSRSKATCEVNDFVAATPISGPACI
jgi:hypothetical protein